jgi:trans-AT polyketide synthase/acyltransferase/oxidoreductase domain-containing protein
LDLRSGWYLPGALAPEPGRTAIVRALVTLDAPFAVVRAEDGPAVAIGGQLGFGPAPKGAVPLLAFVPALPPDRLGDPTFRDDYGVRVNYVTGAMANGIASVEIVVAMAKAGMMGFFGAAGLTTDRIRTAIDRIQAEAPGLPFGVNLIHSPQVPKQEQETVDLLLEKGVRNVEAAAFLRLTPEVVRFRVTGLHVGPDGRIVVPNRIMAKISRPEVATQFLEPPPPKIVAALRDTGRITTEEAELASRVPMADDLTCEADSGGHTDNRPLVVLLPLIASLRDRIVAERGYDRTVRVGAAGGLGCPEAVAAAFALGAAYVVTGSVNQACRESGTSDLARAMLADASMADVSMAPASDMFEQGVEVQVLKRGTLFAARGHKLYDAWRRYDAWEQVPDALRADIEAKILRMPFDDVWRGCEVFFAERDPRQLERAAADAKHKMALVFRWYLGLSSRWAITGDEDRKSDTQVWCGPAIGAFNDWTRGTFLADVANRRVVPVAANLMAGGAYVTRVRALRAQGVEVGAVAEKWIPRPIVEGGVTS